jgi:uncharacterized radical SAM protein YgiQ
MPDKPHFLPITKKELDYLGWDYVDVVLITGDAYVDHPSFGAAVIGRILEREGYRVAIIPQPNWQDDLRDFKKMGKPRLFFGITGGNIDSMVNHYTALKRLRSDDAYTPGGTAGFRPDYAVSVYSQIIKKLYPDVPIVLGGIESSMRRLSHFDYWSNQLKPSILVDSQAHWLVYGMGERAVVDIARLIERNDVEAIKKMPQIAYLDTDNSLKNDKTAQDTILLHSFEEELADAHLYGENFAVFETESHKRHPKRLVQPYLQGCVVINPPYPVASQEEMDSFALFDVMKNAPHPKYLKRGTIPAYEMIKNSITIHRGCFGGCSFCAIAAHQGKFISSRSAKSIMQEVKHLSQRDYFKGHITDLGGPSANMYNMEGKELQKCEKCSRPSCIFPNICPNLNDNHAPLLELYREAKKCPNIKNITIGSGIRYDMLVTDDKKRDKENHLTEYVEEVVKYHVSGRLKVAPEHTQTEVLKKMRKPPFALFKRFMTMFEAAGKKQGLKLQLIPYFISSHPGCSVEDMAELALETKNNYLNTEHVQDFTPTPMTYATTLYYLGYDPYTNEKVTVARTTEEKRTQNSFFFWYKKENKPIIMNVLRKMKRDDLF